MIIGIGGVSRSGKSLVAQKIKEIFSGKTTDIICQDDYIPDEKNIPRVRGEIDWECPESLDFLQFKKAIVKAAEQVEIVIAEGLMVFYDPSVEQLFDRKIFVEVPEEIFRERKITDLRWGPFPAWYMDHIWRSYLKFGKIAPGRSDVLYLDGTVEPDAETLRDYLVHNHNSL